MEQKLPKKDEDGIVRETHVYRTPSGDEGYIEYEYRMVGNKLQYRGNHVGTEQRNVPTAWTEIPDRIETERQIVDSETKQIDEVIQVYDPTDPELDPKKKRKTEKVQRTVVDVPVYADVEVVVKHPYKERFFNN